PIDGSGEVEDDGTAATSKARGRRLPARARPTVGSVKVLVHESTGWGRPPTGARQPSS
ncbi:unnamed protein product, partial [Urochloa humidicola]